jgi:CubicO group peptidase (beta-lactamase class C family)
MPTERSRMSKTPMALGLGLLLATHATSAPAAPRGDLSARIDACVTEAMGKGTPGAAVAVVLDGALAYEQGYGVKSRESGAPVSPATLFRTGSIQKMMTAAAVLAQADRGRLRLSDPVTRLIPELRFAQPGAAERIRVRDLLTHRAGIPNLVELSCGGDDTTLATWAASLAQTPLYSPAGSFWNYSNAGYSLAGLVAERAAGRPYRHVMRDTVWDPAGMHATFQLPSEVLAYGDYSLGHALDPATGEPMLVAPDTYECWWGFPAGDAFTTAGDLARWAATLMDDGGAVLSPRASAALQRPQVPTELPSGDAYGYGVFVTDIGDLRVLHHGGGVPGWTSSLLWVPRLGFAVSALTNADADAAAGAATRCALREVLGVEWPEDGHELTPPSTWRRYTGRYEIRHQNGSLVPAQITLVGDELHVTSTDPDTGAPLDLPARQVHRNTFYVDLDGDGQLSNSAELITFLTRPGASCQETWLRSIAFVGRRLARASATDAASHGAGE